MRNPLDPPINERCGPTQRVDTNHARRADTNQARTWIDGWPQLARSEIVDRTHALGRVLAETVAAPHDIPPFDQALIAGYAVRAAATVGAGSYTPLTQPLAHAVTRGQPMPDGADAVLPFEATTSGPTGQIEATGTVAEGDGMEPRGQSLRAHTPALSYGRPLSPEALGLLAQFGHQTVRVLCHPWVRLEDSANTPLLAPLIKRDGGIAAPAGTEPDLILIPGGACAQTEFALELDGLALRPGGEAGLGRCQNVPVIRLPQEPLACLTAYELLAGRLLRRLGGRPCALPHPTCQVPLTRKISSAIGWVEVVRVVLAGNGAEPLGSTEGGGLVSACRADGFVIIPPGREGFGSGEIVTVHLLHARDDDW